MNRLIPPYLLLISGFIMIAVHFLFPIKILHYHPFNYLGLAFILIGFLIAKHISNLFHKINTELHTFKKPRQLVTSGLFKHSRNPIYVGFVCILGGVSMFLGSLPSFIVVLAFVIITDRWYIPFEEKNMEEAFGEAYKQYKKEVRRWL